MADWAAWYDSCAKPYVKKSFLNDADNLPVEKANDDENDDELCDENTIADKKNKKVPKVELLNVFGLIRKKIQKNTTVS